ncbi:hypothetical protein QJS66_07345 [Kocuria rhizophila]|nr:hypothetical protein QJS66_07345 [Kocuria rhizophila]
MVEEGRAPSPTPVMPPPAPAQKDPQVTALAAPSMLCTASGMPVAFELKTQSEAYGVPRMGSAREPVLPSLRLIAQVLEFIADFGTSGTACCTKSRTAVQA